MSMLEIPAILALLFGAGLGLGGLFAPDWASKIVRLIPDPTRPSGYSEFRGTYGGFFLFSHLMTLVLVINTPDVLSLVASLPIGMAWLGAGTGRFFSLMLDKAKNRETGPIPVWIAIEFAMGLAILSTFTQFLGH